MTGDDDHTDETTPLLSHEESSATNPSAPAPAAAGPSTTTPPSSAPTATEQATKGSAPAQAPAAANKAAKPAPEDDPAWSAPAGLHVPSQNDEQLVIFRKAVGINYRLTRKQDATLEEGRKSAVGIYRAVLDEQTSKSRQFWALNILIYICHFTQIIIGASVTALGPGADGHGRSITFLGATNTIIAGVLALLTGQGLPDKLRKDQAEFEKLQHWIEETEALLSAGIIGRDNKEVGALVETAFKKYNAARASVDANRVGSYIQQPEQRL